MTHDINLILTITGGLGAALLFGFLASRVGLSPIVGYLLAGVLVGPHTPGFVADASLAGQLAEVGVILLMFGVGLHFQFKDLARVARYALPGALVQIAAATGLGLLVCQLFGWDTVAGITFGIAVSVASTVVLSRVLSDHRTLHSPDGHIAIGWLVVEDLFTILVLVLLPVFFHGGQTAALNQEGLMTIGIVLLKLTALFVLAGLFGQKVIGFILKYVSKLKSRELFTLTVLVLALGIAVGSSLLFGASMALGALLAGMIVGQSDYSTRAAAEALPMRDAFAVLFFVSMGMLFDPASIVQNWAMMLAVFGLVIVGKPLVAFLTLLILGRSPGSSASTAIALSQIGEFSFILGSLAIEMHILPPAAMSLLVVVAMVTIALNPVLYQGVIRLAAREKRQAPPDSADYQHLPEGRLPGADTLSSRVVLVGYGPVGQVLHRILKDYAIAVTVVEMNLDTVKSLRTAGVAAIYGDVARPETLEAAGVAEADSLILSAPDLDHKAIIEAARALNPQVLVIGRATYLSQLPALTASGADAAFSGEGETALAMLASVMRQLGSTDEQIDKERERVEAELAGKPAN